MGYNASHMLFGLVTGGVRHPSLWSSTDRAKKAVEQMIKEDWGADFREGEDWISDFQYHVWTLPLSEVFSDEWA